MAADSDRPVVVGVDGSTASYAAVDWGVCEAQQRMAPLRLVHVVERRDRTDPVTARAEAYAHALVTDVEVTTDVLLGEPAHRLVDESDRAAVVVLGDRLLHGLRGLLAGSLPMRAAEHARCPVVVVRPHVEPSADALDPHHGVGRVVVGIDGSALSRAALAFAFGEAAMRGVGLTAVHAWRYPPAAGTGELIFGIYERSDLAEDRQRLLDDELEPLRDRYPQVPVRPVCLQAVSPVTALIHESGGAELLVVGSSGRGGLAALLLGSVSHAVLNHAYCPVAVIHR